MEEKERHIHVAGATGKGKSKVLEQMIRSDIASGRSVCVIDSQSEADISIFCSKPFEELSSVEYWSLEEQIWRKRGERGHPTHGRGDV